MYEKYYIIVCSFRILVQRMEKYSSQKKDVLYGTFHFSTVKKCQQNLLWYEYVYYVVI